MISVRLAVDKVFEGIMVGRSSEATLTCSKTYGRLAAFHAQQTRIQVVRATTTLPPSYVGLTISSTSSTGRGLESIGEDLKEERPPREVKLWGRCSKNE